MYRRACHPQWFGVFVGNVLSSIKGSCDHATGYQPKLSDPLFNAGNWDCIGLVGHKIEIPDRKGKPNGSKIQVTFYV
jgi:hypothetical protein